MKKINLLFLVLSLNFGGTERHIHNLVSALNRNKFNIVICCLFDLGPLGEAIRENYKDVKIFHNVIKHKLDIYGLWKLIRIVRREKIHILYTINSPLTQYWGVLLAGLTGSACITRVATTNPTYHANRRRIVNRLMLPFVDRVIAQADSHKDYLVITEGMNADKVMVVYNGVELEKYNVSGEEMSFRKQTDLSEDGPIIGIVARLAPEKGHELLIKAARKIVHAFPKAIFLVIGEGKERNRLEDLSREYSVRPNIVFLGARKDIPKLLSLFDVAVLSSYDVVETFSNAILEYMAAGKPVVATNSGSTRDLVSDGETGLIVPCGDFEALTDSILKLLRDSSLAKEMGEAGRKKVEKMFTLQQMVFKYESLFDNIISRNIEKYKGTRTKPL